MIDPQKHIAALIPAAGYSSRMGAFKPLLPLGDGTVIDRVIGIFRTAGIEDIIIVVGYAKEQLIPVIEKQSVRWVENDRFEEGMFSSIRAGIKHIGAHTEAFFLLPCDVPFVKPETFTKLVDAYQGTDRLIIRPCYRKRRGHPPLISASFIPFIHDFNRPGGLRALLAEHESDTYDVECDDEGILINMNTMEDYTAALKKVNTLI